MFYVGLDLGQKRDHSAIAVIERLDENRAYQSSTLGLLVVRHVERVPLGTSYPGVVEGVRRLTGLNAFGGQCSVIVDATGVGAPVVDLLKCARLTGPLYPVTITGGEREHQTTGGVWNVPKRDLIAGVEVLLDKQQLRIVRELRDAGSLVRELMDVRMTSRSTGRIRIGADGCGEHDDLVIALALACWGAKRSRNSFGTRRLV